MIVCLYASESCKQSNIPQRILKSMLSLCGYELARYNHTIVTSDSELDVNFINIANYFRRKTIIAKQSNNSNIEQVEMLKIISLKEVSNKNDEELFRQKVILAKQKADFLIVVKSNKLLDYEEKHLQSYPSEKMKIVDVDDLDLQLFSMQTIEDSVF